MAACVIKPHSVRILLLVEKQSGMPIVAPIGDFQRYLQRAHRSSGLIDLTDRDHVRKLLQTKNQWHLMAVSALIDGVRRERQPPHPRGDSACVTDRDHIQGAF